MFKNKKSMLMKKGEDENEQVFKSDTEFRR